MRSVFLVCFVVLLATSILGTSVAEELRGKVVAIADGDTLTVLDEAKVQHKIRLEGIDAPEKKQAYGSKASDALGEKVFPKDVRIVWKKEDLTGIGWASLPDCLTPTRSCPT